jgi:hypothetical protein
MTLPPEDDSPDDLLLPEDELMALAEIDENDIEAAIAFWDEYASEEFKGALNGSQEEL